MNWSFLREAGCEANPGALLAEYTTFRIGGPCPCVVTCETPLQLSVAVSALADANLGFVLIGGGSNLLVSDAGIEQVVVRYCAEQLGVRRDGNTLDVDAAMGLDDLAAYTVGEGLAGLVYASGIPGTVGGAVVGNAGAFGEQIGDRTESVVLMDHRGELREEKADALEFAYRRSRLQDGGDIVVSVRLRVEPGDRAVLARRREEILDLRRQKHPDWRTLPTAGSFFKNIEPTSAAERRQAAGWFLEQAGAKAMRIGKARVFEKHANIIVADPGCSARDVLELSRWMADAVKQRFGLVLSREVRLLGKFL